MFNNGKLNAPYYKFRINYRIENTVYDENKY